LLALLDVLTVHEGRKSDHLAAFGPPWRGESYCRRNAVLLLMSHDLESGFEPVHYGHVEVHEDEVIELLLAVKGALLLPLLKRRWLVGVIVCLEFLESILAVLG